MERITHGKLLETTPDVCARLKSWAPVINGVSVHVNTFVDFFAPSALFIYLHRSNHGHRWRLRIAAQSSHGCFINKLRQIT